MQISRSVLHLWLLFFQERQTISDHLAPLQLQPHCPHGTRPGHEGSYWPAKGNPPFCSFSLSPWHSGKGARLASGTPGFDSRLRHNFLSGYPARCLVLFRQCWDWSVQCQYTGAVTCISVAAHTVVWADPSLRYTSMFCWDVKQPGTNQPTALSMGGRLP